MKKCNIQPGSLIEAGMHGFGKATNFQDLARFTTHTDGKEVAVDSR